MMIGIESDRVTQANCKRRESEDNESMPGPFARALLSHMGISGSDIGSECSNEKEFEMESDEDGTRDNNNNVPQLLRQSLGNYGGTQI